MDLEFALNRNVIINNAHVLYREFSARHVSMNTDLRR